VRQRRWVFEQVAPAAGECRRRRSTTYQQLDQVISLSQQGKIERCEQYSCVFALRQRFDELTAQAQRFIGGCAAD